MAGKKSEGAGKQRAFEAAARVGSITARSFSTRIAVVGGLSKGFQIRHQVPKLLDGQTGWHERLAYRSPGRNVLSWEIMLSRIKHDQLYAIAELVDVAADGQGTITGSPARWNRWAG